MNAASVARLARRWVAIYTVGMPADTRDRRREEIAGDLWEQQHAEAADHRSAAALAVRLIFGMPADCLWRAGERRTIRRLEMSNLAIDRTWDRRIGLAGRGVVLGAISALVPIALGLPVLVVVTIPAAALIIRQQARNHSGRDVMTDSPLVRQRRTRFAVAVIAVVVWALGFVINSLPGEDMHDRYWYLFVAPLMVGAMVGMVAVPMLIWSLLPRRDTRPLNH